MQGPYSFVSFLSNIILRPNTQFVEDEGDIIFYKNAYGLATTRPVFSDHSASDSGVEIDKDA